VLVIAKVVGQFSLHGAFENGFGELFKQAVFAEHVTGLLIASQLVGQ
jgi:hypothetical protein